ncbi:hypothetical protein [Flavobacterium terrigena]|uniref:Lipoprotein n=1 Tax=Flavobacterium terrigena TaxID=402734 RepID=A0A1H6WCP4_9FLAO|nr:hypothetical protein [Flavobacterium terrigena]SEJ10610.1 hypothetical protein SAMN05660918_2385 [Flavobacterium terrigena]
MKKILFIALSFALFSCSSNDDSSSNETSDFTNALPLNTGNYWTYDVVGTANTRDSLYISGDTIIAPNTYKKFKNKDNVATGFYCTSVNNNGVRKSSGKLLLSGDFSFGQGTTLPVGLDLHLVDFIIFKEYATSGEVLHEKTGSFEQDFNGTPLTITYKLKSVGGENFANFTSPNGDTYTNVKSTKIILNLKVTTTQTIAGMPIVIPVLQPQDVVTSTQYISKSIGVVYTKTKTTYNLNATIADQLGIPASNTQNQEEFLDTFVVN